MIVFKRFVIFFPTRKELSDQRSKKQDKKNNSQTISVKESLSHTIAIKILCHAIAFFYGQGIVDQKIRFDRQSHVRSPWHSSATTAAETRKARDTAV